MPALDTIEGNRVGDEIINRGVDYGNTPEIVAEHGRFFVVRIKGSKQWVSRGEPWEYWPTEYFLAERVPVPKKALYNHKLKVLEEHRPGKHWQSCLFKLEMEAKRRNG